MLWGAEEANDHTDRSAQYGRGEVPKPLPQLVQRSWRDNEGNRRQSVEIQVTHVGPDLQFATAEVAKSTAEGLGSASDKSSSAEEKQSA